MMLKSRIGEDKFRQILNKVLDNQEQSNNNLLSILGRPTDWKDLQKKVKKVFDFLGCSTKENYTVKGVRTSHDVDVFVEFYYLGSKFRIIVECKNWNSRIKKAQVATLKTIINETGAEKGLIVSKIGFQKGAYQLAKSSNIDLVTFDELIKNVNKDIIKFQKNMLLDKINALRSPFENFCIKMKEEAEKKVHYWHPSNEGHNLLASLYNLKYNVEELDKKSFPRNYIYSYIEEKDNEHIENASNAIEYLNLIMKNLEILEKEYNRLREEIFSE